MNHTGFKLIITIVNSGHTDEVLDAAKEKGAEGGTILNAKGMGIHEDVKFFGVAIEPEKEVVLTLIDETKTDAVLENIILRAGLDTPGRGIAFVLPVDRAAGIPHLSR